MDSTSTLATHIEEKPEFILIWGSDILQWNEKSWNTAKRIAQETADKFGLKINIFRQTKKYFKTAEIQPSVIRTCKMDNEI